MADKFDMNELVKLAVDGYKGKVEKNFSVDQSQDALRQALIEANNGSTKLNYRDIRDGKCVGLFSIIEEILSKTVVDGLQGDEFFMNMVDFRNMAEGDQNKFVIEDSNLFVVAKAADGTQGIRRQRLSGVSEKEIDTDMHVVRIYEELNRVLAGRVDFNDMIAKVSESFRRQLLNEIYALWISATTPAVAGGADLGSATYFPAAGSYNANTLLTLIEHVEAAAGGKPATLIGTKAALRKLNEVVISDAAKDELHKMGYYGSFYGTPCIAVPQRHKIGTTQFVMDDNVVTVVAGEEKPIKVVYEGDPLMIMGDPLTNADLTHEYFYGEKYGMGLVLAGNNAGIGCYTMT